MDVVSKDDTWRPMLRPVSGPGEDRNLLRGANAVVAVRRLRPVSGPGEDRNGQVVDVHVQPGSLRPVSGPGEDRNRL